MDLWIRCQDREGLFKVDKLWYSYDEKENEHCINNYEFEFGVYKSKERALEVLDEIQSILKFGLQINNNNQFIGTTTYVYEMPKE